MFFDQSILQGSTFFTKGPQNFITMSSWSSPGSWGWRPSSYIVAQYLMWNYELQPVNGLCILHNCVQVKVVIEAKKEEKSGDIRWGHDHRESDSMRQLHIVSIPNSSQEEHLVIFFQCNFMVQLKSAQTECSHELCFGWEWSWSKLALSSLFRNQKARFEFLLPHM